MFLHHWPNPRVPWRSFHNHWIVRLVEYLNQEVLPEGFQARPTELIVGVEPDVLLLQGADRGEGDGTFAHPQAALAEATLTAVLPAPPELPMVGIYSAYDMRRLISIIEIVSPGNKDRPQATRAFIEKALFLLHDGVHVMVIDPISLPSQPIRYPLLKRLGLEEVAEAKQGLWVSSYCALPEADPEPHLTVREWAKEMAVGQPLPTLPLFLQGDQAWVMVDLQESYQKTVSAGRYAPR